jgi:hypothetical protein
MNTSTATTSTAAGIVPAAPLAEDRPAYRYAGEGRFLPANDAAHEECRLWNAYADTMNARTARRSLRRHDH